MTHLRRSVNRYATTSSAEGAPSGRDIPRVASPAVRNDGSATRRNYLAEGAILLIASSRSTVTGSVLSDPAFSHVVAETVCGPVNVKSPDTVGLFPIIALKSAIRFFCRL